MGGVLIARLDNTGDVVLAGPAVRAVAASGKPVTFLASTSGLAAARLLPGVSSIECFDAPWVSFDPPPADREDILGFVGRIAALDLSEAIILTSFHQSPLPLALLLRLAGVERIAATCVDYPGSLLDVRQAVLDDVHEVEQALATCEAAGYRLPPGDRGQLRLALPPRTVELPADEYVVVHPGASVPARALPVDEANGLVAALSGAGRHVVVTGSSGQRQLAAQIAGAGVPAHTTCLAGQTELAQLAHVLAGASAVVCGNTGPAHLAAAVGTPVVQAFAPVVPAHRWRPWGVSHVQFGTLDIGCAGCRSRDCPVPAQPCLRPFTAAAVVRALDALIGQPPSTLVAS